MLLGSRGHFEAADKKLHEIANVLEVMPWREAVHLYVISYVVCLHARGDPTEQRAAFPHLSAIFGSALLNVPGYTGALWILHLALAAIWAGDHDLAARLITEAEQQPSPPNWLPWVCCWLRGLIAEAEDRPDDASKHLDSAIAQFTQELPLYRAHVWADRARLAAGTNGHHPASDAIASATELYRMLGATPYLDRVAAKAHANAAGVAPSVDVLAPLSDRERDVAALLVAGLSYAQIGAELFISRATVGFHLGRIYAKTNVNTRHELVDLMRRAGG
jgi:DNA-binding CsgD family transcriptional regulator